MKSYLTSPFLFILLLLHLLPTANADCSCLTPWQADLSPPSTCMAWMQTTCYGDGTSSPPSGAPDWCQPFFEQSDIGLFMVELEIKSISCDKPYITYANYNTMITNDALSFDRGTVAMFFMIWGASMGINTATNPNFPDLLYANDINGRIILQGKAEDLIAIGFTTGNAKQAELVRTENYVSTSCTCVTQAWGETGPVPTCIQR